MICLRCHRTVRAGEGLKCGVCESRYHLKCAGESNKDHRDSGDRGYKWQCALCQRSVSKLETSKTSKECHELMNALNSVNEKIEVVNKIQLPKFYNDLAYVRNVTEHITKQNENILRKIEDIDSQLKKSEAAETFTQYTGYNTRSKILATKSNNAGCINERHPMPSGPKKTIWYRSHRPYLLHKVLRLLNNRKRTSRRYRK